MPQGYTKEATYQFADLYLPGNGSISSPMCLQSVIMESKRTLEVPEWSLGGFEMVDALRTHPGSFISIFMSRSYVSPERHPSVILGV